MILKIYDSALSFIGEIDNFPSCIITRKYLGIDTLELTAPISCLDLLLTHNWIMAGQFKIFEILHMEIDQETPRNIKIMAFGGGKTLSKRITIPPEGEPTQTVTGSYEEIVYAYCMQNASKWAPDESRRIPFLSISNPEAGVSEPFTDSTRYKNLYDEVVRVLSMHDAGMKFTFILGEIAMIPYKGRNLTISSTDNPPAVFSIEYNNIKSSRYIESAVDIANLILVGGQGEALERAVVTIGSETGIYRYEAFVDARDTSDPVELQNRGTSEANNGITSFESEVYPNSSLTYEEDYDVGDMVTVQDKTIGIQVDTRITEAVESYQSGQAVQIQLKFGNTMPTFLSTINNQRKKIAGLSTI